MLESSERGAPLSPAQQGALLPERLRGIPAANLFLALEISGELDTELLGRATMELVSEHEILRTIYPNDRRMPYQRIVSEPESVFEVARIDDVGLESALQADAGYRFDPVEELPIRIRCYILPNRHVVSLAVHPVAADDRTLDLLAHELFAALENGQVTPAAAQYRTFAVAQLEGLAAGAANDPDLAYWLERLDRLPGRAVPRSAPDAAPGVRRRFRLGGDTLAALSGGRDTAAFVAVLTCALGDAGMGQDIPVGVIDPARTDRAYETMLGNIANHLVLRLGSMPDATPADAVTAADRSVAEAHEHAGIRSERLGHELLGTAAMANGALFQVQVAVRTDALNDLALEGSAVEELVRHGARPHGVDVAVDIAIGTDGATVTLDFPASLSAGAVDEFAAHLERRCLAWANGRDELGQVVLFEPGLSGTEHPSGPGLGGPPHTEAERIVAASIRRVLDFAADDVVGRADTFFSLGGDSIAALRLVTDLVGHGYALEVQTVFGYPAIHELALQLAEEGGDGPAETVAASAPMSASGLDPATLATLGAKLGAEFG